MSQIKIVTDSTADLPQSLVKELNISVIPLKVNFKTDSYREGIDISTKEFYEKLTTATELPTTSQPTPNEFEDLYVKLTEDKSSIISIHISSKLSGTMQAALIAKNQLFDHDITVIDSKQVSMALGLLVIIAARAAKEGKSKEEIIDLVNKIKDEIQTYFVVDTLEYLHKGGRIGKAAALVGTVLNIKPVLTIQDGMIAPFEKIRGKTKALERISEIPKEFAHDESLLYCGVVHANCLEEAIQFHQKVVSKIKCNEYIISEVGAVVGTHCGPGTIAVFFYKG